MPRETTPSFEYVDFRQIAIPSDGLLTKKKPGNMQIRGLINIFAMEVPFNCKH